jgi:cystathionine beta-lyase
MVATFTTGHLGVIASIAAYREGSAWLADVVDILDGQRRLLADLLAEQLPVVGYVPPEASYLAWLDLSATGLGDDPAAPIIERGRVALSSGIPFGAPGFARLNLATSPAILREIVRRIVGVADGTDRVPVLE